MIFGIGLDLADIHRIEDAYKKRGTFPQRVLTPAELILFHEKKGKRQMEFLAGRFAAKEAFSKALGTGIGKIGFLDIEILPNEKGQPIVTKSPFDGAAHVSITHTDQIAAAQVVLEA